MSLKLKQLLLFLFIALISTNLTKAQQLDVEWIKKSDNNTTRNGYTTHKITTDHENSIYKTGIIQDSADFDPGPGVFTLRQIGGRTINSTYYDHYIQKLDSNGNFVWAVQLIATSSNSSIHSIAVDSEKSVYITGFLGSIDFDPGIGTAILSGIAGNGSMFIAKLDSNGQYLWAKKLEQRAGAGSRGNDIVFDSQDNVIIAGFYINEADFNFGTGRKQITQQSPHYFVLKIDKNSNFIWVHANITNSRNATSNAFAIALDNMNNVIVAGEFTDSLNFNPDPGGIPGNGFVVSADKNKLTTDVFILKLDSNGKYKESWSYGGNKNEYLNSMAVDYNNNIITTGYFTDTANFEIDSTKKHIVTGNSSNSYFIHKIKANGTFDWVKTIINVSSSFGQHYFDRAEDLVIDNKNNIYVVGQNVDTVKFETDSGIVTKSSGPPQNQFRNYVNSHIYSICPNGKGAKLVTLEGLTGAYFGPICINKDNALHTRVSNGNNSTLYTVARTDTFNFNNGLDIKFRTCTSKKYTDSLTACDTLTWIDGITYNSNNNTASKRFTVAPCGDSTRILNLKIKHSTSSTDTIKTCSAFTWTDGKTYTTDTTVKVTIVNAAGCDSVMTLLLDIDSTKTFSDTIQSCDSYKWTNGLTYTKDTIVTQTVFNTHGCDSIKTLDLQLSYSTFSTDTIKTCNAFTWTDGKTYTSDTMVNVTIMNSVGCDSVMTLLLDIGGGLSVTDSIVACDYYQWIDSSLYLTSNNTAKFYKTNSSGCDTIVSLDLTLNYSTTSSTTVKSCTPYTWLDGKTYSTSNTRAEYILTNSVGCDSIIKLDLTIPAIDTGITQSGFSLSSNQKVGSFQWLDCGANYVSVNGATSKNFTPSSSGNFAVQVSLNGCSDTSKCLAITLSGIEQQLKSNVSIYPNPTSGIVNIDLNDLQNVNAKIYSSAGQLVYYEVLSTGLNSIEIQEVAGVYILELEIDSRIERYKLIKD